MQIRPSVNMLEKFLFFVIFYLSNGKKAPVLVLICSNKQFWIPHQSVKKKKKTANELISTISGLEMISLAWSLLAWPLDSRLISSYLLAWGLLWARFCVVLPSHVKALILTVAVFRDGAFKEVIKDMCWVCAKLLQSCPTPCDPMDCSSPGSSVHGIF